MEEGLKYNDIEQGESDRSPEALTERTLRTVADRIRQMDGRYKGKYAHTHSNKYKQTMILSPPQEAAPTFGNVEQARSLMAL